MPDSAVRSSDWLAAGRKELQMTPTSYMMDEINDLKARESRSDAALKEISRLSIECLCAAEITRVVRTMNHISAIAGMALIDAPSPWRGMDSAPKSGGAERRDDPKWVDSGHMLMAFTDGEVDVVYHDPYWVHQGFSGWVCASAGERIELHYNAPVAWMPLPIAPVKSANEEVSGRGEEKK